jgi:hypothetical protein
MNEFSTRAALPAVFKIIKGQRVWQCGVGGCCGRLATVFDSLGNGPKPGQPDYEGPYLTLPSNFDQRRDGFFAKTQRSAASSADVRLLRNAQKGWRRYRGWSEEQINQHLNQQVQTKFGVQGQEASEESLAAIRRLRSDPVSQLRLRDWDRTSPLRQEHLKNNGPLRVCCPGCGRVNIITCVTGSNP